MTVTIDELIKWILSQTEELPDDEQASLIYKRVFLQDKENTDNGNE